MTRFARTTGGFTRVVAVTCTLLALGGAAASLAAEPTPAPAELRLVSDAWPPFTGEAKQPHYAIELVEEDCVAPTSKPRPTSSAGAP